MDIWVYCGFLKAYMYFVIEYFYIIIIFDQTLGVFQYYYYSLIILNTFCCVYSKVM